MRTIRLIFLFVLVMVSPSAFTETNITVTEPVTVVDDFVDGVAITDDDSTITNQSDVNTEGFFSDAIVIIGDNANIFNNPGSTAGALGDQSDALAITGNAGLIINNGSASTDGDDSATLFIEGDSSFITNGTTGVVTASGNASGGMILEGNSGDVDNLGSVLTTGDNGAGMGAFGDDNGLTNAGDLTTTGTASDAMRIDGQNATIDNFSSGTVSTTGAELSNGLLIIGDGGSINNEGDVSIIGNDAGGVRILGDDGIISHSGSATSDGINAPGVIIEGLDGIISTGEDSTSSTTGDSSTGMLIVGDNGSISHAGSSTTSGFNAASLRIDGLNAELLTFTGSAVTTAGDEAPGMIIVGDNGNINHAGSSNTTGFGSDGQIIVGLDASIGTLAGSTTTTIGEESAGAIIFGDNGTITHAGSTTTSGLNAEGLVIVGQNAFIGNIADSTTTTNGDSSSGIIIFGDSGTISHSGSATTSGNGSAGLAIVGQDAFAGTSADSTTTTTGDESDGVVIFGDGGTISHAGSSTTNGVSSFGLAVIGQDAFVGTSVGSTSTANADGSAGIFISGDGGTVFHEGAATINGADSSVIAIFGNDGSVINEGSMLGTAPRNGGIQFFGSGNNATNSGTVVVEGADSEAVMITGTSNTVTNTSSGVLEAQSVSGTAVAFFDNTAADSNTLINLGVISAPASGQAVLGSDGEETIDNSGTINGNVLLGGGADTFILRDMGEVFGIIDGEAGVDSLEINTGANDRTLDGSLFAGFDLFTKSGSGTLFTTGNWDLGGGNINLAGGQIALQSGAGLIFDTITIDSGGTLSGPGTIDGDIINQGGTLTPAGTLTVLGSYTQTSGSLDFSIAGLNEGEFDVLSTTGDIDLLGGSLNVNFVGGFVPSGASGVTLLQSQGNINVDPGVAFNVGSGDIAFDFTQSVSFPIDPGTGQQIQLTSGTFNFLDTDISETPGLTGNEGSLAESFDDICVMNLAADNLTPAEQELVDACRDIRNAGNTPDQIMDALEALDTEEVTQTVNAVLLFTVPQHGNLSQRVNSLRSGSDPFKLAGVTLQYNGQEFATVDIEHFFKTLIGGAAGSDDDFSKWTVFGNANFNFGDQKATANGNGFDSKTITALLGVDYRVRDDLVVGGSVSYSNVNANFNEGGGMDLKSWAGSVFASFFSEKKYYIDVLATYGFNNLEINRHIIYNTVMGGTNRRAKSDTDGHQSSTALGVGYDFNPGAWIIGPHGGLNYTAVETDGYTEKGAGGLNLSVNKQHATSFTANLGMHVSYTFTPAWGVITPYVRADWVHEFQDDSETINVRFEADRFNNDPSNPSLPIRVETDERDSNYYVFSAGASVQLVRGVAGFINYRTTQQISNFDLTDLSWGIRLERSW